MQSNSFEDLEHLKMRWKPQLERLDELATPVWHIVTDELDPWYVAKIARNLPGDMTGEATAKAICDAHNAQLATHPS